MSDIKIDLMQCTFGSVEVNEDHDMFIYTNVLIHWNEEKYGDILGIHSGAFVHKVIFFVHEGPNGEVIDENGDSHGILEIIPNETDVMPSCAQVTIPSQSLYASPEPNKLPDLSWLYYWKKRDVVNDLTVLFEPTMRSNQTIRLSLVVLSSEDSIHYDEDLNTIHCWGNVK